MNGGWLDQNQKLEYPFWKNLAIAIIGQAARDYVYATMILNGQRIAQSALTYEVRAHPEKILEDCEDFFFGGWFRLLSLDTGMDGMEMAGMIEADYRQMYENMRMTGHGRLYTGFGGTETKKERNRRVSREKYRQKVAEKKAKMLAGG